MRCASSFVSVRTEQFDERSERARRGVIERETRGERTRADAPHPRDRRDDDERIPEVRRIDFQGDDASELGLFAESDARPAEAEVDEAGRASTGALGRDGDRERDRPTSEGAEVALRGHRPRPYHGKNPKNSLFLAVSAGPPKSLARGRSRKLLGYRKGSGYDTFPGLYLGQAVAEKVP